MYNNSRSKSNSMMKNSLKYILWNAFKMIHLFWVSWTCLLPSRVSQASLFHPWLLDPNILTLKYYRSIPYPDPWNLLNFERTLSVIKSEGVWDFLEWRGLKIYYQRQGNIVATFMCRFGHMSIISFPKSLFHFWNIMTR